MTINARAGKDLDIELNEEAFSRFSETTAETKPENGNSY